METKHDDYINFNRIDRLLNTWGVKSQCSNPDSYREQRKKLNIIYISR